MLAVTSCPLGPYSPTDILVLSDLLLLFELAAAYCYCHELSPMSISVSSSGDLPALPVTDPLFLHPTTSSVLVHFLVSVVEHTGSFLEGELLRP